MPGRAFTTSSRRRVSRDRRGIEIRSLETEIDLQFIFSLASLKTAGFCQS